MAIDGGWVAGEIGKMAEGGWDVGDGELELGGVGDGGVRIGKLGGDCRGGGNVNACGGLGEGTNTVGNGGGEARGGPRGDGGTDVALIGGGLGQASAAKLEEFQTTMPAPQAVETKRIESPHPKL